MHIATTDQRIPSKLHLKLNVPGIITNPGSRNKDFYIHYYKVFFPFEFMKA